MSDNQILPCHAETLAYVRFLLPAVVESHRTGKPIKLDETQATSYTRLRDLLKSWDAGLTLPDPLTDEE